MQIYWVIIYSVLGWVIRLVMVPVVLRRQFTPGAALAWLGIIFLHPYIGFPLYLLVGERRLGRSRREKHLELVSRYRDVRRQDKPGDPSFQPKLNSCCEALVRQAQKVGRMPVVWGNQVEFLDDYQGTVDRLLADIAAAKSHVNLLYYIFAPDDTGRRVVDALAMACLRGVTCRVLADAFASRAIFRRHGLAEQMRNKGVRVAAALPSALLRRRDLRNHRKLAIIDDRIAFAGSQNLVNSDYGGRRGAPWVDLTVRLVGPVVSEMAAIFAEDWAFETDQMLEPAEIDFVTGSGPGVPVQVVATGPIEIGCNYRRVLLAAMQSASRRLIMTTPYFVPDDPTLVALMMAADRGVEVSLILPQRPDHFFAAAAGRAHFSALLEAGVGIYLYRPGLVHAKSATVDDDIALVGTANLDARSFNLNFELSVLLYGREMTQRLAEVQTAYLNASDKLDLAAWQRRPVAAQCADEAVSLASPLL